MANPSINNTSAIHDQNHSRISLNIHTERGISHQELQIPSSTSLSAVQLSQVLLSIGTALSNLQSKAINRSHNGSHNGSRRHSHDRVSRSTSMSEQEIASIVENAVSATVAGLEQPAEVGQIDGAISRSGGMLSKLRSNSVIVTRKVATRSENGEKNGKGFRKGRSGVESVTSKLGVPLLPHKTISVLSTNPSAGDTLHISILKNQSRRTTDSKTPQRRDFIRVLTQYTTPKDNNFYYFSWIQSFAIQAQKEWPRGSTYVNGINEQQLIGLWDLISGIKDVGRSILGYIPDEVQSIRLGIPKVLAEGLLNIREIGKILISREYLAKWENSSQLGRFINITNYHDFVDVAIEVNKLLRDLRVLAGSVCELIERMGSNE